MLGNFRNRWRMVALAAALLAGCADAVGGCTVPSASLLDFGTIDAASSPDQSTNSGSSFWVNCTSDVKTMPKLYSGSARAMTFGAYTLPFRLSLVSPGAADLPTSPPGMPLAIAHYNINEVIPLYSKILASDFRTLPAGVYATAITLTLEY